MRRSLDPLGIFNACLFVPAILAGISCQGTRPSPDEPEGTGKPAVKIDDQQILEIVLLDLLEFKEFDPSVGGGKKTTIILSVETAGSSGTAGPSGFLSDGELDGESLGEKQFLVHADIRADLRQRNPKEPVSLAGFRPASPKIIVRDPSGRLEFDEFEAKLPDARGYVEAWLPGYSRDGRTAVLRAWFGPTPHGATVTYMLAKKEERWAVLWRKVAYYV